MQGFIFPALALYNEAKVFFDVNNYVELFWISARYFDFIAFKLL